MTKLEIINIAKHFHPGIKNAALVSLQRRQVEEVIRLHYKKNDDNFCTTVTKKYSDRGWVRTIGGRILSEFDSDSISHTLIMESAIDIMGVLLPIFNCAEDDWLHHLTDASSDIAAELEMRPNIIQAASIFNLNVPFTPKLEVTLETDSFDGPY